MVEKLTPIQETIQALLFPFTNNMVYIPVLPKALINMVESPFPYLFGIHSSLKQIILETIEEDNCIVDIDNDKVEYKVVEGDFYKTSSESKSMAALPKLEYEKLLNRIAINWKILAGLKTATEIKLKGKEIRGAFLKFFVRILKNYKKHLDKSKSHLPNFNDVFNVRKYIGEFPSNYKPFLSQFVENSLFQCFIYLAVNPKSMEDMMKIKFFNEKIQEKINKSFFSASKPTPFLSDSKTFQIQHTYIFDIPDQLIGPPTKILDSYYENNQVVPFEFSLQESGQLGYRYLIHPEFNPQCYAALTIEHVAKNLSEDTEKDMTKLNKYPMINLRKGEVNNKECVYLAWIELWCASLWYIRKEEHSFRLEQLLDVLRKAKEKGWYFPKEIFQLIMQVCLNFGNPDMVIKIYQHLELFKIKADGALCTIFFNALVQKEESKERKGPRSLSYSIKNLSSLSLDEIFLPATFDSLNPKSKIFFQKTLFFKRRTLLLKAEQHIVCEEIQILVGGNICSNCGIELNFENILKANKVPEKVEIKCYKCKESIFPQMKINIGKQPALMGQPAIEQTANLMVPVIFKEMIEKLAFQATKVKVDILRLREYYKSIFWNAIFYFSNFKLPYDLFLPYKQDVFGEGPLPEPVEDSDNISKFEEEKK